MKLQTKARTLTLSGTDKIFDETKFKGSDFEITLKEVSKTKSFDIFKKCTTIKDKKESTDFMQLGIEQLKASIVEWKNFNDEDENEIELNDENVERLYEFENDLCNIILLESTNFFSKKK